MNIACPYTSTEEVEQAELHRASQANRNLKDSMASNRETNDNLLLPYLYTGGLYSTVDLLVRTSGVRRLSNFLLYQVTHYKTQIYFVPELWPQFSLLTFLFLLIDYQANKLLSSIRHRK
jgi:undecaprenyl diphosphate synthase